MDEKNIVVKHQVTTTKFLDFVIFASVFLVFFLCPLFFTGLAAQGLAFEKMILFYFLALLGVVAWVTKAVILGELNFKRTPLDWPIVALLAVFIISTISSISPKDSLIGSYGNVGKSLASIIVFILFYYLVINNLNRKRIKIVFWGLVASGALLALYSALQLLGRFILPLDFTKTLSFNPLGSLTGLTMFLVMVLPLLVIGMSQLTEIQPRLYSKILQIIIKSVLGLIILLALFILTLLNGFTFWPAAVVAIVIVLMFLLAKIIRISSANLIIPIATFLLLIILLVLGNFNVMSLSLPAEISLSRQTSYNIAKASLIADPLFGSGPSTFYYSFIKYKGADFNASPLWNVRFDNPSGYLFELAATAGGLGALIMIIIFLTGLSLCFLALIKTQSSETQPILLALFASLITVIIFNLLFSLNNALVLVSVLISVLTLAVGIIDYPEKFKSFKLSFRASPKYALALAAIFLSLSAGVVIVFTLGVKMYLADFYARQSLEAVDINEKIAKINQAIMLAPYQDVYYFSLANNYLNLANREAVGAKNQSVIENSLALAIDRGKKGLEISPNNAANLEAMALIYENASFYVRGALEWAESLYNQAMALEPDSPTPYLRLALINMARANAETAKTEQEFYINEAIKKYELAIAKKNDFGAAYYGQAVAYEKLNNPDKAIDQLKQAVLVNNDNLDYRFELGRLYFNRGAANADDIIAVKNDDIKAAEQLFLSIVQANPNHANALYSLALLYQKTGETANAGTVVGELLKILTDGPSVDAVKKQFPGLY